MSFSKYLLIVVLFLSCKSTENSKQQHEYWRSESINKSEELPEQFVGFKLIRDSLDKDLLTNNQVDIPLPDGSFIRVLLEKSGTMSPELENKFPNIKSYTFNNSESQTSGNLDSNTSGIYIMINHDNKTYFINPVTKKSELYICYEKQFAKKNINNPFIDKVIK